MSWTKIGGAADSLAIFGDTLCALAPNKKVAYIYNPSLGTWKKIGSWKKKVSKLVGGGWDLYVLTGSHTVGLPNLIRYNGTKWRYLGGTWAEVVGICNTVYALDADRRKLFRFSRYTEKWKDIGNIGKHKFPAPLPKMMHLVGGGSRLYVTDDSKEEIWEYSRVSGKLKKIGKFAASMWVGAGDTVYALTSDKKAVLKHMGLGLWTKIGGPAENLIGGGSLPYAIEPGISNLWRYRGKGQEWDKIGTPGREFVAVANAIYGMTTDKKEVHQFDDSNSESKRLLGLLGNIFASGIWGDRVIRGFLIKEMNGKILANHRSDVCFQPHSTLKLLPYLHAIIDADTNKRKTINNIYVSWVEPKNGSDEYTPCLDASDPNNRKDKAPLRDALPTLMWESHNRTLEALFAKYGTLFITKGGHKLGLSQTEMYPGCPKPDGSQLWLDNITTLVDLAKIFEGVQSLRFLSKTAQKVFYENMINWKPAPGESYPSPITGVTSGPATNQGLEEIVKEEAGPGRQLIAQIFMSHLSYRGKGGGIEFAFGSDDVLVDEIGVSFFLELTVPFKISGQIKLKKFLIGWYINQRKNASAAEEVIENKKLDTFSREIHRLPIRLAINTW